MSPLYDFACLECEHYQDDVLVYHPENIPQIGECPKCHQYSWLKMAPIPGSPRITDFSDIH